MTGIFRWVELVGFVELVNASSRLFCWIGYNDLQGLCAQYC